MKPKPLTPETLEQRIERKVGYYQKMMESHGKRPVLRILITVIETLKEAKCSYPRCP